MSEYYTILTTVGQAKIANAIALGQTLDLATVRLGDANGTPYNPTESQTALVNQVYSTPVNDLYIDENNADWAVIEAVVPTTAGGWTVREVGVFDNAGDMIAIAKFPPTYKPVLAEGAARDLYIKITLEVGNAATVTLQIDPAVVLASRQWVEATFLKQSDLDAAGYATQVWVGVQGYATEVWVEAQGYLTQADLDALPKTGIANLLINANAVINQRAYVSGTATSGANEYTLDRWRVVVSGESLSWTDTAGVRELTAPAGGIEQVIEGTNIIGGTHVINWEGTATCTVDGTARAKGDTFTLTAGTNATVRFSDGTVSKPKLERGSAASDFEFQRMDEALAACKRYYQAISLSYRNRGATQGGGVPQQYTTCLPVNMRVGVSLSTTIHSSQNLNTIGTGLVVSADESTIVTTLNPEGDVSYMQVHYTAYIDSEL